MSGSGEKPTVFKCLPVRIRDKSGRPIEVRNYEAADFEALCDMYESFEPKGLECGLPALDGEVRLRWINYVVADLFNVLALYKGRVIGHVALDLSDPRSCPEYLIFIQEGFRNLGIGTALSRTMKKVAGEAGCNKVVVTVRTANRRAIKVFERVGFRFCGDIEECRDMELRLKRAKNLKKS